ncbi:YceI-like domain protein [Bacteriovorax sp. BSW11_IV]|uniref:YceI family protein n=1 Tax=Bacteriovorax sp. BSW11_IV TaxID=1353529 RepID=UPI00038A19D5|nr:YceI family protein [Bacteriovorax sp. BSW11_IV]EQC49203.1 YceI-like domain protein [Bacteriovorax sp. BSW11_IV]
MRIQFLYFITFLLCSTSFAEIYSVNKEHSAIKFNVAYMKMLTVEGKFLDYSIHYKMDGNKISDIEGRIATDSISTDDKKRDQHLRDYDFFYSKKYPYIEFHSLNSIIALEEQELILELKIKDKVRKVPVKINYLGEKSDPWTKAQGHYFSGSFKIKRSDYDITWNKKLDGNDLLIGEEVTINLQFEAYKGGKRPAFSRFFKERKKPIGEKVDQHEAIVLDLPKTQPLPVVVTKDVQQHVMTDSIDTTTTEIVLNVVVGFIIFSLCIAGGILLQSKISRFFEKRGASDTFCYLSSSTIVMVILIIVSVYTAPYMGHGENPLLKFFK